MVKRSKYNAQPVTLDGYRFDSKREAARYQELKALQRAGVISELTVHPVFALVDSFKHSGATVRGVSYEADFGYTENGRVIIEDVKGVETDVFKIKRKLFWLRYPDIEMRVVK